MQMTPGLSLFLFILPLLAALSGVLGFAAASAPQGRQHATTNALALALLSGLAALILARQGETTALTASQMVLCSLAILAGQIIAAPLLDRARTGGLLVAATLGALVLVHANTLLLPTWLPPLPRSAYLLVLVVEAAAIGLVGSYAVPTHPARMAHQGMKRLPLATPGWVCAGLAMLAIAMAGSGWMMEPAETPLAQMGIALPALGAALLCLLIARRIRHPQPLRLAHEGLVAGVLVGLLCPATPLAAATSAVLAALCVLRGEAIAHALRLDDPSHHTGMLLLPALVGLILPVLADFSLLAMRLQWLGAALLLACVTALVLWPVAMALLGLAATPRRVREGLDYY